MLRPHIKVLTENIMKILPILQNIHSYQRGQFQYFLNTETGTWVAIPLGSLMTFVEEYGTTSQSSIYHDVYGALCQNEIIRGKKPETTTHALPVKPLFVNLQTTGKCNLQCTYCFNNLNIRNKTMTETIMHQAVEYALLNPFATNGVVFAIYGGEPLMERELLYETINFIREKKTSVHVAIEIITNGTMLTEEDIVFFKKNKVEVLISFDGLPSFQNHNRQGLIGEKWSKRFLKNADLLKKNDYTAHCSVLCVVTNEMSTRLLDICKFMQESGFYSLEFMPLRTIGCATHLRGESIDPEAYIHSLQQIVEAIEKGTIHALKVRTLLRMILPFESPQTVYGDVGCFRCSAGRNSICIDCDGNITGCDMLPEQISPIIGNIWSGVDRLEELDKLILSVDHLPERCKKCPWFRNCRGGCPGGSASDGMAPNNNYLLSCFVNKAMYPFLLEKLVTDGGILRKYFHDHVRDVY